MFYPDDASDIHGILSKADCAMYSVKESGKDGYRIYSGGIGAKFMERVNMESDLRHALERNEFVLHYQPLINLRTGEILGVEALIRWNHPVSGLIPPGDFIPLAEETGLIVPIGEWALREACRQNKAWQAKGCNKFLVSVNLSARQLKQPGLIDKVRAVLDETGLEAQYLNLEITESIAISNIDFTVKALKDLNAIGINIALDDFGTGYSSLSYLKRLPINVIKIDKSFISAINEDIGKAAIAEAVITMAHKMNIKVTAEGVETLEQLQFLHREDCDTAQGYYFSRPLALDGIEKLIRAEDRE